MSLAATLGELLRGIDGVSVRVGDDWIRRADGAAHARTWTPPGGPEVEVAAGAPEALDVAAALVAAAARMAEAEHELEGLYEELGTSYESLSSIYEIGSDPSLLFSPDKALAKIIDRALAFEIDLKACFWLVNDGRLRPAQWRNTGRPEPRDPDGGLVGRALREKRGLIVNGKGGEEPELAAARRIAISPMISRDNAIGALVVWHEAPGEFDSRLMGLLTSLSSQAAMILEQERLRKETVEAARLRQEVAISGDIQQVLLLGEAPAGVDGMEIGTVAHASRQIDGDFFGFFAHDDSKFDVLVGDVMGKGIPAALVGAAVKSQFVRFASTLLPSGERRAHADPAAIVGAVHREVATELIGVGRFVTAVYARLDLDRRTLTWVDCGHTNVLHYRGETGEVETLEADLEGAVNLPLGVLADTRYVQASVPFAPGDCFAFYSDGITEATDADDNMFGADALARALAEHHALPAQEIADAVDEAVTAFASADGINDDVTCIIVKAVDPAEKALEIPARSGQLEAVRDFVDRVCAGTPFGEEEIAALRLALNEAASNIIRHAYADGREGTVRIEAASDAEGLTLRLIDRGLPFDPSAVPPPSFDGSRSGGFGVYIIREIMDEVAYARDAAGCNRLVLRKRFTQEGKGA